MDKQHQHWTQDNTQMNTLSLCGAEITHVHVLMYLQKHCYPNPDLELRRLQTPGQTQQTLSSRGSGVEAAMAALVATSRIRKI